MMTLFYVWKEVTAWGVKQTERYVPPLFRNKWFLFDEMTSQNASKFVSVFGIQNTTYAFFSFCASSFRFHIPKSSILLGHYIVNLPLISKECSSELGGKTLALLKLLLLHQPDTDNQKSSDVWIQWELNSCNASKKLLTELESHLRFFGKYLYRVTIR